MARANPVTEERQSLYVRDSCQWLEQQVGLPREGRLQQLDIANLVDEIEDLGISRKHAVTSILVVVLNHCSSTSSSSSGGGGRGAGWRRLPSTGDGCARSCSTRRAFAAMPAKSSRNATRTPAARL
jgi:Domain of unknown function DUF29